MVEATNGKEGLDQASDDFDLVLLDWNMPEMSGIDALKGIRAKGLKVPVIMVTTEAEKARVIEAVKSGANNYIIKPFTPEGIEEKIKKTLKL